jgi:anti-anti-sigma factor
MDKSQNQFLTQHTENGVVILTFTEPTLSADAVAEVLSVINTSKTRKVILDCQSVRFLIGGSLRPDQEPLTPLLKLSKQLTGEGGRLVLCNVAPSIDEVFRATRLAQFFEIQPDVHSAAACLTS